MSDDEGTCDEQAQANVVCAFPGSASERLEDVGLCVRRNRVSVVVDGEPDAISCLGRDHRHGRLSAVFDRVANKIGHDLGEPVGIPLASHVPARLEVHDRVGVTRLDFQDNLLAHALQIRTDSLQRNDTPEARPRQVEQVCNHARHALSTVQNPRCDSRLALVIRCGMGQQRGAGRDRSKRAPQIMTEDPDELITIEVGLCAVTRH